MLTSFVLLGFLLHLNGFWTVGLIDKLEQLSYDARIQLDLQPGQDERVVIIDIDEESMAALGQWPWPRHVLAQLIDRLYEDYKVAVLGFDTVMPEPDGRSLAGVLQELTRRDVSLAEPVRRLLSQAGDGWDNDRVLADSLRKHEPVLGLVFKGSNEESSNQGALPAPLYTRAAEMPATYVTASRYTGNIEVLQSATPYGGFFDNPTLDADGVFRRVPLLQRHGDAVYGSLALMLTWRALGGPRMDLEYDASAGKRSVLSLEALRIGPELRVPVDENVAVLVPYRGRQGSFAYVPVIDVLERRADPALLEGRIAILGTSAPGLRDVRTTPVGTSFSGVEVHANIVSGILDGRVKHKVPYLIGIETSLMVLISLLLTLLFPRLSPVMGTLLVLGMVLALFGLSFGMWEAADFVVPLGGPLLFLFLIVLIQMNYGYFVEARAKREVSRLFGHYVPPELVSEMAQDHLAAEMRSDSREMTVLFSDVRNFTSISERLTPDDLTTLMNEFLTPLTEVIHKKRGTIDKYMGDAVMAFWGAPLPDEQHARRALEAALGMVECMHRLASEFKDRGLPELKVGVGVNTGVMSVGNMGSKFRMAYTVLGDAVNLGSRLEGLTKNYGVAVICSDSTRQLVQDWMYRDLDRVRVKGKAEPVAIFEPLGPRDSLSPELKKELAHYRQALQAYRNQDWSKAELQFYQLRQQQAHKIYDVYLERIAIFMKEPPGPDWDGVFTHTSK